MAVYSNCLTQIPLRNYGSSLKYPKKELKARSSFVPLKKAPAVRITKVTASIKNKVYEDRSEGIVCYEDERGEIICEGYDEGPCFQRIPKASYHLPNNPRDAEIRNLVIQQGWLQIAKEEEKVNNDTVESLKRDLNCNGFNSFR
ncbi:hypothetical protein HN51_039973 [Arachis hypogaea]|uniref:Uncharacterized protein n=1 Tax=Arachis hypogaea TaxID=3818 RepID=A0A444YLM7_ARAHY|nr:uncharacterized protein LOC107646160 [Arachis ipaensis]XP_020959898.1 uncharacterized protein LOC107646160 [Arachis ipaensis]XP_025663152.1 uncharacterized protein LOC112758655 isoform X2 [Arachis hypogaea]XP_025663153.1 uncharacterized protein LOC112758655 isoform X2 [Arachis hypogaea]QHN85655.1 uncharacterized protein DS421_16g539200 [Arachis hypogaea]QHN85656.1 uncharacterized protein DS421_16g539200 [Arachis hypogaea]RYR02859.1 hypothetical protein Ahy_B06g081694 isoform A [Arachis hyp